jgi:molecular chaperone DnaK
MSNLEIVLEPNRLPSRVSGPVRVIGIDLGTTNCTVAEITWDPAKGGPPRARCLEIDQETDEGVYTHVLVPSVVAVRGGERLVGEGAKRLGARPLEHGLEPYRDIFRETKNHMGIQKTYHRAPEGFRHAREIAGHILEFLYESACLEGSGEPDQVVVTVPASFQASQRRDTLEAARLAGVEMGPGNLLDEPVAAFLHYLAAFGAGWLDLGGGEKTLLVFDFGGGTCDVGLFRLHPHGGGQGLRAAPMAVSRYHRLGGGDIDAAIVH